VPGHRPLITGVGAGVLALGADYLAHALFAVPLLPEQAGFLLLKVLPLSTFENMLKVLGVLARPLLLLAATVVIIALYGAAAQISERLFPRIYVAVVTVLAAVVGAIVALVALSPGDSTIGVVVEVVLLAATIPLVDRVLDGVASTGTVNEDRRILLRNLFYGAVGIAVLGIGYVNVRRFTTALAITEGTHAGTEITNVNDFYVVEKDLGGGPVVNASTWRLNLPTRSLTYDQLLALSADQLELTLECISNDIGGTLISNGIWKGPRVSDVLALTSVPSNANWMLMESADGYTESFPLSELTPAHLLATHLNGAPLTAPHGFPARFIFPGHYGMKQPKWVTRIRFSAGDQPGYWEKNGWDERAIIKTMSRIDRPADGTAVAAGSIQFGGIAFAGSRRISGVELSWDGGRTWQVADLHAEFAANAWRFWQLTTSLPAGHYKVSVRARDGEGTLQTSKTTGTLPNGADGYHSIALDLA
jgi:DMSO/TMAO reductase YedYZ molybdopterin-dependent catalytic subunit